MKLEYERRQDYRDKITVHTNISGLGLSLFFDLSFNNFLPLAEALLLVPVGNDLNILKADIGSL